MQVNSRSTVSRVCVNADMGANSQLYWLLILLAFPALRMIRLQAPEDPRLALILWPAVLKSVAALGFTLEKRYLASGLLSTPAPLPHFILMACLLKITRILNGTRQCAPARRMCAVLP